MTGHGVKVSGVTITYPAAVGKTLEPPNIIPDPLFTVAEWNPDT